MKPSAWIVAAAVSVSSLALAQTSPGVTESTDPAKIAEIERHAQELASRGQTAPMAEQGEHMRKQKHVKRHKSKAKAKKSTKEKAPSDTPMATESKG